MILAKRKSTSHYRAGLFQNEETTASSSVDCGSSRQHVRRRSPQPTAPMGSESCQTRLPGNDDARQTNLLRPATQEMEAVAPHSGYRSTAFHCVVTILFSTCFASRNYLICCCQPKHNYKALRDRQSDLQRAEKAKERPSRRKTNRKASDVRSILAKVFVRRTTSRRRDQLFLLQGARASDRHSVSTVAPCLGA